MVAFLMVSYYNNRKVTNTTNKASLEQSFRWRQMPNLVPSEIRPMSKHTGLKAGLQNKDSDFIVASSYTNATSLFLFILSPSALPHPPSSPHSRRFPRQLHSFLPPLLSYHVDAITPFIFLPPAPYDLSLPHG